MFVCTREVRIPSVSGSIYSFVFEVFAVYISSSRSQPVVPRRVFHEELGAASNQFHALWDSPLHSAAAPLRVRFQEASDCTAEGTTTINTLGLCCTSQRRARKPRHSLAATTANGKHRGRSSSSSHGAAGTEGTGPLVLLQ